MCQCPRVLVEAKFMKNIDFVISIHDAHIIQRYRNHAGIFIFQKIKSKFNLPTFQYPKQRSKQRANLSAIGAICPLHFLMLCRWTPLAPAEDFYSLCSPCTLYLRIRALSRKFSSLIFPTQDRASQTPLANTGQNIGNVSKYKSTGL